MTMRLSRATGQSCKENDLKMNGEWEGKGGRRRRKTYGPIANGGWGKGYAENKRDMYGSG